ncbi:MULTISPECIES: alpha/beta fold hydrolase [Streptomyces]|uniref:Pimeloyl-ACP methyl ester carboxylesterase n=1 Tax=Streptomyces clavifer TaxID=68188 RepID=A0ABS4VIE7_9ACTN|nr:MULTISPECIES: alpha/beta fold hydrolase [Streptomyces]MBP2363695.1 pimeloyl-ACP methyl ester carboxylesterase [Streptomyces clavifer]MDX2747330.1 alpha/beta fold hydrolase [Streptomyces sp. NRRL_B-2557]GHB25975.1 alpha/beta hydrolase [Streptomyces clavifer]
MAESDVRPRPTTWATAPNRRIVVGSHTLVYRDLGPASGVPLVLLTHLGATLDEWDPRFVDALARDRRVVALDLPGVGGSTGRVPGTVAAMARSAEGFVAALGLTRMDLLGFSLGGFIAQQVALDVPGLVRRLVLAGTGPAGGAGIDRPTGGAYVYWDMARAAMARTDAKEFLFFPRTPTGKAAAEAYLARLRERVMDRDAPIRLSSFRRQITTIRDWGRSEPQDLARIIAPTLIANGDHDRMVPTDLSHDMHARIPGSTLIIYPGAGHGGVFQHVDEFVDAVRAHLHTDS